MFERDDGPPAQDTQRPSARWAFMGQSHTELEDRLLAKIDAERAVERIQESQIEGREGGKEA